MGARARNGYKPERYKSLSRTQVRRLLTTAREARAARDYFLLSAMFYLALRVGEAVTLQPRHFHVTQVAGAWQGEVLIPTEKRRVRKGDSLCTMTGRPLVPVRVIGGGAVLAQMARRARGQTWLFPGAKPGRHASARTGANVFKRWAAAVGIPKQVSSHALRHTAGSLLYMKTKDRVLVRDFCRHRSVETTDVYLHARRWGRARGALRL